LARELAEVIRESDRPDEVLSLFFSILYKEHGIDYRDYGINIRGVQIYDVPIVIDRSGQVLPPVAV
jgi:hypothetical protein